MRAGSKKPRWRAARVCYLRGEEPRAGMGRLATTPQDRPLPRALSMRVSVPPASRRRPVHGRLRLRRSRGIVVLLEAAAAEFTTPTRARRNLGTRNAPWESTPCRLAQTRTSACRASRFPVHANPLEYTGAKPGQRFRVDNDAVAERIRHVVSLSESGTYRARSSRASCSRSSGRNRGFRCSAASLRATDHWRWRPPPQPPALRNTASSP